MKEKLAIVGSGIAAMGSAYYLRDHFDITIFEKNDYVGGHTNTIEVPEGDRVVPVDTGFIVFNEITYPNLCALFDELGVESRAGDMSFSVYNEADNLQWAGKDFNTLFAQRRNIFRPRHWRFLLEANRFNSTAADHLATISDELSLADYLKQRNYHDFFIENYIIPMGSAVWSTPVEKMVDFPAKTLIQFFKNHGFLGMNTHFQWRTVVGGSWQYMKRLQQELPEAVRINEEVRSVERASDGVIVRTAAGSLGFDRVLIGAHADQALRILARPSAREERLLGAFSYEKNVATLHSDASAMPPLRKVWSAWNYKIDPRSQKTATLYYMNQLQGLRAERDYFVSINDYADIDAEKIVTQIDYEHPLFDARAIEAQKELSALNENERVYYAGSYFRYGFHEDALWSARQTTGQILASLTRKEQSVA